MSGTIRCQSTLIPVRIDSVTDDKAIRIVDTLLFDPTCWPITLYQPLFKSVEQNVVEIAHNIISDAEVQGMGRTVRHFTGRVDLWSKNLQKGIENQLRPQLWKIATMNDDDNNMNISKLVKIPIPISIRLIIDRVVIHEDILWDPNGRISPFEFAEDMSKELNLPDEATIGIAITVLEQIYGLPIDQTQDPSLVNDITNKSSTGAWMIDPKEQASTATQVVAQHRSI